MKSTYLGKALLLLSILLVIVLIILGVEALLETQRIFPLRSILLIGYSLLLLGLIYSERSEDI